MTSLEFSNFFWKFSKISGIFPIFLEKSFKNSNFPRSNFFGNFPIFLEFFHFFHWIHLNFPQNFGIFPLFLENFHFFWTHFPKNFWNFFWNFPILSMIPHLKFLEFFHFFQCFQIVHKSVEKRGDRRKIDAFLPFNYIYSYIYYIWGQS